MKKRILAMVVCISMLMGLVPVGVAAEAESTLMANAVYDPVYLPFAPLNQLNFDNGTYINKNVVNRTSSMKKNNAGVHAMNLNFTGKYKQFKFDDGWKLKNTVSANMEGTHKISKGKWDHFSFEFNFVPKGTTLTWMKDNSTGSTKTTQLAWVAPFRARNYKKKISPTRTRHSLVHSVTEVLYTDNRALTNHYNSQQAKYFSKRNDSEDKVYKGNKTALFGFNNSALVALPSSETGTITSGVAYNKSDWQPITNKVKELSVWGETDGGHEPSLDYFIFPIMIADKTNPKVVSIVAKDASGKEENLFMGGEKVLFDVNFNEYIRLYNDNTDNTLNNLTLDFQIEGDQTVYQAKAVSLKEKTMTFEWTVPTNKNLSDKRIKMRSLGNQKWATTQERSTVTYVQNKNGSIKRYSPGKTNAIKDIFKVSIVTDLAGNPMVGSGTVEVTAKGKSVTVDNTLPFVEKITLKTDNDALYLPEGAAIEARLYFSEPVRTKVNDNTAKNLKNLSLITNVKNTDGSYLELTYNYPGPEYDHAEQRTFAGIIPEGAVCEGVDYIRITEVKNATGNNAVIDKYGNEMTILTYDDGLVSPQQQYTVDTNSPTVEFTAKDESGNIAVTYPDINDATAFYLEADISDDLSGLDYTKGGYLTLGGLVNGEAKSIAYRYKVTDSPLKPESGWSTGEAMNGVNQFNLLQGKHYIHIDFDETAINAVVTDLSMTLTAYDGAGNSASDSVSIDYQGDFTETKFSKESYDAGLNTEGTAGEAKMRVRIDDGSGVSLVEYQWVPEGNELDESAWTDADISNITDEALYWIGDFTLENIPIGEELNYTLYIRATDERGNIAVNDGFAAYVYVGDAAFKYTTLTEGTLSPDHSLVINEMTDAVDDKGKKVTVKVIGGANPASPEWTLEKTLEHTYNDAGEIESFFGEFDVFNPDSWDDGEALEGYYGKVTVLLACINTESGAETNVTLEYFFMKKQSDDTVIHDITITPLDREGNVTELGINESYTSPEDGVLLLKSLAGYSLKIEVGDNLLYPDYEREDIDYVNSYAALIASDGSEKARVSLTDSDEVLFNLPAESDSFVSGEEYSLEVVITDIAGHVDTKEFTGIIFDSSTPEKYGITRVYREVYDLPENAPAVTEQVFTLDEQAEEIYVSSLGEEENSTPSTVRFEMSYPERYSDMVFAKVWNESIDETKESAAWIQIADAQYIEFAVRGLEDEAAYLDNTLRVQDGVNFVKYVFITANGYETLESSVRVYASSVKPQIAIEADGYDDEWTQKVDFTLTPQSMVSTIDELNLYATGPVDMTNVFTDGYLTTQTEGEYNFGVTDKYQNTNSYSYTIDNIDTTAPQVNLMANMYEEGRVEYDFSIFVEDDRDAVENIHARVTVGLDFAEELGLIIPEDAEEVELINFDEVAITEDSTRTEISDTVQGLKSVTLTEEDNFIYMAGEGIFPYKHENGTTVDRSFKLYVSDTAGNEYTEEFTLRQLNVMPRLEEASFSEGNPYMWFNVPVKLIEPVDREIVEYDENGEAVYVEPVAFRQAKDAPWLKPGGTYSVRYVDAWGYEGVADFTLDEDGSYYAIDVNVSTYDLTNKDVTVVLDATKNDMVFIALDTTPTEKYTVDAVKRDTEGNIKYAFVTVHENTALNYTIENYAGNEDYNPERMVAVSNINKTPVQAEVTYFAENAVLDNNTTWGTVTAFVNSTDDRELSVTEGEMYFTFTYGGETEYTFNVMDDWGNVKAVKAVSPFTIIAQPEDTIVEDTTPPEYEYEVSVVRYGSSVYGGRYDSVPDSENPLPVFYDSLVFTFNAFDENAVTYSVKNVGEGVTIMGNMIAVTKNTSFTMVMTDSAGNSTEVPITVDTRIDTKPYGEVIYVDNEEKGTVKAFINTDFAENDGRNVRVVGATSLGYENGMYYKEFFDNGTYTFNLTDDYSITNSVIAAVDKIDSSKPIARITRTSPGVYTESGEWSAIDTSPTRQNVAITVEFAGDDDDEPIYIREITPTVLSGSPDDVTVTNYGDSAVIILRENAQVKIDFTAANGRSGSLTLPEVDFIERNSPVVTITKVETEELGDLAKSITLTFEADREVYFTNGGAFMHLAEILPDRSFTKKITQNGEYTFSFVDVAGNVTEVKFTVTNINTNAPVLTIDSIGEPENPVNYDLSVNAHMDMDGTIRHLGVDYPVTANEVIELNLPYNGMYEVLATGANSLTDTEIITVTKIDKESPVIIVPDTDMWLKDGVDYYQALTENLTAYDNMDGDMTDKVEVVINDNEPVPGKGTYAVTYKATDRAGNETVIATSFTVYDDTSMIIMLNGEFVVPGAMAVIDSDAVAVTTNLGDEPYKVYYAKGMKTAAQMKYEGILSDGNLTLTRGNYYTVYVVTQDRETAICTVYVEN